MKCETDKTEDKNAMGRKLFHEWISKEEGQDPLQARIQEFFPGGVRLCQKNSTLDS
jgi:hypothetical protein